jgi:hypothetical protein
LRAVGGGVAVGDAVGPVGVALAGADGLGPTLGTAVVAITGDEVGLGVEPGVGVSAGRVEEGVGVDAAGVSSVGGSVAVTPAVAGVRETSGPLRSASGR